MSLIPKPVHILGLRPGSLSLPERGEAIIRRANVLVGGRRLLAACALACPPDRPLAAERQIPVTAPLDAVIRKIRAAHAEGKEVAVLADGDPLFFGFGRRLIEELGAGNVVVHPNVSTVQLAAARLKIPAQDIAAVSLHGRDDFFPLLRAVAKFDRVAVFTDETNTPSAIARALLEKGATGMFMTVLEDLDTPQEVVRRLTPEEVWDMRFSPLNLVLVERSYPPEIPLHLGVPDHFYFHEKELITKLPVRAAGLAMLGVLPDSTVWDLGAGCGAVAIEASHLASEGRVFAVERENRRVATIRENIRRMGAFGVEVRRGEMPDCLAALPDPDRIFLGGGLGGESNRDNRLLETACGRLRSGGRIVVHCILLDTLLSAKAWIQGLGWAFGVTQVQASTTDELAGDLRFKAQNPVFILWAEKP